MTLVLEESEDIPSEMLSPFLHYVKKDDEVRHGWSTNFISATNAIFLNLSTYHQISQISRRLAEKVLSNCASKLKTYLTEAVKSSGVPLDKYGNIVALICEGTFSALQEDQVFANEKEVSLISHLVYCSTASIYGGYAGLPVTLTLILLFHFFPLQDSEGHISREAEVEVCFSFPNP